MQPNSWVRSETELPNSSEQQTQNQTVSNSSQGVPQLQSKESTEKKRSDISRKFKILAFIQCILGGLLVILGAIGIYYGAPDVPYVIPFHVITGVMMLPAALLLRLIGNQINRLESATGSTICLMVMAFLLNIMVVSFALSIVGMNGGMGIAFCLGTEYSTSTVNGVVTNTKNDMCTQNQDGNIAFSALFIVLGVLAAILGVLLLPFLCVYGMAFSTKNRQKIANISA